MRFDRDFAIYIFFNIVVIAATVWLLRRSVIFMGTTAKTWNIILFAGALGLAIFIIGQVVLYVGFKQKKAEMEAEMMKRHKQ